VSCVVPTHDRPAGLRAALRSILAQSVRPAQIIVVDDVGGGLACAVVDEIRNPDGPHIEYVDVSTDVAPKGAAYSRNRGAELAEQSIVAFLDDDDVWLPDFLEVCLARLGESNADLVATDLILRSSEDDAGVVRTVRIHTEASSILADNPGVTGSNFVIRRAAFERIGGFDPCLPVNNDLDFLVRLIDAGMRYESTGRALVVHSTAGPGHLSSRGERRASGVERYLAKYSTRLSRSQRRALIRDVHRSRRGDGQPIRRDARLIFLILVNSPPREVLRSMRIRMTRSPRPYT
jgi:glycosyltransferase involved in cell wall biosynthesis